MDPPKKTKKKAAAPPPARVDTCECCGKRGTGYAHCSRCKCARYCSRACQRKDWRSHKQSRCVVPSAVTWEEMIAMEVEGRTADNIKGFRPSNRGGRRKTKRKQAPDYANSKPPHLETIAPAPLTRRLPRARSPPSPTAASNYFNPAA